MEQVIHYCNYCITADASDRAAWAAARACDDQLMASGMSHDRRYAEDLVAQCDPDLQPRIRIERVRSPHGRYHVHPIASPECDAINKDVLILATDDLEVAEKTAAKADYPWGAGILDTETGELDVGFGFGVPCP